MNIGANIRERRRLRGMTQEELAKAAETTQRDVSLYETGKREPRFFVVYRLAAALGCKASELFGDSEE